MELSVLDLNGYVNRLIESQGADEEARNAVAQYALTCMQLSQAKKDHITVEWEDGPNHFTAHTQEAGAHTVINPETMEAKVSSTADSTNKSIGAYVLQRTDAGILIWPRIRGIRYGAHSKINFTPPYVLGTDKKGAPQFFGMPNEVHEAGDETQKGEFWIHDDGREEIHGMPTIQRNEVTFDLRHKSKRLVQKAVQPSKKQYLLGIRLTWGEYPDRELEPQESGWKYVPLATCLITPPGILNKGWKIDI